MPWDFHLGFGSAFICIGVVGFGMLSQRTVNAIAVVLVVVFVIQSGYDMANVDYEVPGPMYGIIAAIVAAVVGSAAGIQLSRRNNNDRDSSS